VAIQKAPPSTAELIALGAPIVLRDGSRIRLRQGHRSDKALLLRGFARLSPESRHRRFLGATPKMSGETVRYLTEIDHHDHEAIAALDEETGDGIGIARYIRDPARPDVAEAAVTVIDDWQAKGVGTLWSRSPGSAISQLPRRLRSTRTVEGLIDPAPLARCPCSSSFAVAAVRCATTRILASELTANDAPSREWRVDQRNSRTADEDNYRCGSATGQGRSQSLIPVPRSGVDSHDHKKPR
jgi:hypothetical protein